jgi:hypothetical protein
MLRMVGLGNYARNFRSRVLVLTIPVDPTADMILTHLYWPALPNSDGCPGPNLVFSLTYNGSVHR